MSRALRCGSALPHAHPSLSSIMRIAKPRAWALVLVSVLAVGCKPVAEPAAARAKEPSAPAKSASDATGKDAENSTPQRHYTAKPTVDPIKANGEIFVDWPKPNLAIMISGELDGYIEPCGCAGLENQLGGLKRRHTLIKQLEADGWPLVQVDVGGLVKRRGLQTEIKYRYALESLVELGYDAIALGAKELQLNNIDAVAGALMNLPAEQNPVVSANVGIYGMDESVEVGMTKRYRIVEQGGKRIGVTSVLGAKHVAAIKGLADIATVNSVQALSQVAPELAQQKCDLQILLVHGHPLEAQELSQKFPQFQIVATAGGAEEPPKQPKKIEGSGALLIEAGHKGMYVIVLGLYDDPAQVRYQRVPLDSRFADSPEMQAKLTAYQQELETMTLAGLGLRGTTHPDGDFAGSAACADCHTKAWAVFEKTPHYHATDTLVKLDPPRHFDPECLSCHVTGWNPQEYIPYKTGYLGLEETPEMKQNGCENCHGPALAHVKVESGELEATEAQQEQLRATLRMKIGPNEGNKGDQKLGTVVDNCMECHDIDNSPDFDFQAYWPKVKHVGKD
jgi:hypothetical protein